MRIWRRRHATARRPARPTDRRQARRAAAGLWQHLPAPVRARQQLDQLGRLASDAEQLAGEAERLAGPADAQPAPPPADSSGPQHPPAAAPAPATAALPLEQAVAAFDTLAGPGTRGVDPLRRPGWAGRAARCARRADRAEAQRDPRRRPRCGRSRPAVSRPASRRSSGWGSNSSRSGSCTTSWPAGSPPGGPNAPSPSTSRRHHTGTRPPSRSTTPPRAGTRLTRGSRCREYRGRTVRVVIGLERIEVYDPATGNRIGSKPHSFTAGAGGLRVRADRAGVAPAVRLTGRVSADGRVELPGLNAFRLPLPADKLAELDPGNAELGGGTDVAVAVYFSYRRVDIWVFHAGAERWLAAFASELTYDHLVQLLERYGGRASRPAVRPVSPSSTSPAASGPRHTGSAYDERLPGPADRACRRRSSSPSGDTPARRWSWRSPARPGKTFHVNGKSIQRAEAYAARRRKEPSRQ